MAISDSMRQQALVDIEHRFSFHPATGDVAPQHDRAREILRDAATQLLDVVPAGREAALVLTKLEEAMFWANAGIARQ